MRRLALPVVLGLLSLSFAPAPLPRARRNADPLAGIEGTWRSEKNLARITRTRITFLSGPGADYDMTLHPASVPPSYTLVGRGKTQGRKFEGIYRLEGDTLIMADNPANEGRPTRFDAAREIDVYRRVGK
jgi:uncharacterized protein (TIGR03067 family)